MSTQKTIAMFAVLCLIALGLGYWVGQPKQTSRKENGGNPEDWGKPKHEVLAVENAEKFSISVGDRLSFNFKDGTCNDGYRFILLVSHKEESANSLELIAMLDRYWGSWQEGKTNKIALERNAYGGQAWNNIYIPFKGSAMKTPPLLREPGWHSAELLFLKDFLELKIDGKSIGSMTNPPVAFNAAINSSTNISIMSAPSHTSAYPTVETEIKNITIQKIK